MKSLLLVFTLMITTAYAQEGELEDLGTINLQLEESSSEAMRVNYPGYRMGGGTPPGRVITDCLLLDVQDSDGVVSLATKRALANRLIVEDGFRLAGVTPDTLPASVKGDKVIFRLTSGGSYVTQLSVRTKNGESLKSNVTATIPRAEGMPVGLVYVRSCRF